MHISRLGLATLLVSGFAQLLLADVVHAQSFGRWHVPSTPAQFFGCGYGGGHHAPMVRMPGARPVYVNRLAFVPPHERTPEPGRYPLNVYPSYGCSTPSCSQYRPNAYAPQINTQPAQPILVPVAQPLVPDPVIVQPQPPMKPQALPRRPQPALRQQEGKTLPAPKMPTADPVTPGGDHQAIYGF